MQRSSVLVCSTCEELVSHQTNLPISLHRNSASCACSRNSRLEFPSADIQKDSYPARQISEIPDILSLDSTLSALVHPSLPIQKARLYRQFLAVASSDHRLDFSLSLHCFLQGGSNWLDFSVIQTYSGSLVESLIVSVSNILNNIIGTFLLSYTCFIGDWVNSSLLGGLGWANVFRYVSCSKCLSMGILEWKEPSRCFGSIPRGVTSNVFASLHVMPLENSWGVSTVFTGRECLSSGVECAFRP